MLASNGEYGLYHNYASGADQRTLLGLDKRRQRP